LAQILSSNKLKKIPGKINVELMRRIIMQLCDNTMCTRNEISALLDRDPVALQNRYLTPMVAEGLLEMKYPANKNHPDQAYRTRKT
jgi:ATP-dependent DNA helicase RecG